MCCKNLLCPGAIEEQFPSCINTGTNKQTQMVQFSASTPTEYESLKCNVKSES